MRPAQQAEGCKDGNYVLIWTKISFIVFIILINNVTLTQGVNPPCSQTVGIFLFTTSVLFNCRTFEVLKCVEIYVWFFFLRVWEEADKNEPFTNCQTSLTRSTLTGPSLFCLLHAVQSLYKVQWPSRCLKVIPWLCVTMETRVQKWNRSIMFSNTVQWEKGTAWRTNAEHRGGKVSTRAAAACLHHHL